LTQNQVNRLTDRYGPFTPLCSTDKNGLGAGSVTEVIIEARSTGRELVATVTASAAVAEADVVGSRQADSARRVDAGRSAIVYSAGSPTDLVDSVRAVCNNCV
jgi:hypothetical protein